MEMWRYLRTCITRQFAGNLLLAWGPGRNLVMVLWGNTTVRSNVRVCEV